MLLASCRSFTVLKLNANDKVTGILLHSTYTLLTLHIQFNAAWSIIPKAVLFYSIIFIIIFIIIIFTKTK